MNSVQIKSFSSKLDLPVSTIKLSQILLDIHDNFNQKVFDKSIVVPKFLQSFTSLIYNAFGQQLPNYIDDSIDYSVNLKNNTNDVLLAFSSGLDSVFQAIKLKEAGYNVHLYIVKNINRYENNLAYKFAKPIADKLGLELIEANFKYGKKNEKYSKIWPENPIKNQLIYASMIDYCYEHNWNKISAGDDFDLKLKDAVAGINLTDAEEVTKTFISCIKSIVPNLEFIPIAKGYDKSIRIKTLIDYQLEDLYYSCVQAGRFNQTFHKKSEEKYHIKLMANNCGCYCRKCAMHNLLLHYKGIKVFPQDFLDACWKRMWNNKCSADYEFFKPELSIEQRISNLFTY